MNWMYLTAGALAAGAVAFHGVYGYAQVAGRLDAAALPSSFLGDGREALWMLRLSWHVVTAVFAVAAVVLIAHGLDEEAGAAAPRAIAAILAIGVVAWVFGGGSRRRFLHPGLYLVGAMTALTIVGSL